jgi:hypothetical protein
MGCALGILWFLSGLEERRYGSIATVWVERPAAFSGSSVTEFNPYISPAQNQTAGLRELLATQSFVTAVARDVDKTEVVPESRIREVRSNTSIIPFGEHVVYIQYESRNPNEVGVTVKAILDRFTSDYSAQIKNKATIAANFYGTQIGPAKAAYDKSNAALQEYIRGKPQLASANLQNLPTSAVADVEFAKLIEAQLSAKENYNRILTSYDETRIAAISTEGISPYFAVLDQPSVAFDVLPSKKTLLIKPIIGGVAGLIVSAIALVVIWRVDRKVRLPTDLAFLGANLEIVSLPKLATPRRRRWPKSFVRLAAAMQCGLKS